MTVLKLPSSFILSAEPEACFRISSFNYLSHVFLAICGFSVFSIFRSLFGNTVKSLLVVVYQNQFHFRLFSFSSPK